MSTIRRMQFEREIGEVANKYLFQSYHKAGYQHIEYMHMGIFARNLRKRLERVKFNRYGNNQIASRFLETLSWDDVCQMLSDCLMENIDSLEKEFQKGGDVKFVAVKNFDAQIGEAYVKGLDQHTFYPQSRLTVVVGRSDIDGRLFKIMSAYPDFNFDEQSNIDDEFDALEEG